jgi:hypothetical protein
VSIKGGRKHLQPLPLGAAATQSQLRVNDDAKRFASSLQVEPSILVAYLSSTSQLYLSRFWSLKH